MRHDRAAALFVASALAGWRAPNISNRALVVDGQHRLWELFREYYDFYSSGKKADRMRWLVKLNRARNITHHTAEKGPLPRDQIAFVRRSQKILPVGLTTVRNSLTYSPAIASCSLA